MLDRRQTQFEPSSSSENIEALRKHGNRGKVALSWSSLDGDSQ